MKCEKLSIHNSCIFEQTKMFLDLNLAALVALFFSLDWLVGCFGFNGPLRQYFSLYRAVSQREGERGEKRQMREKMSKQPPPAPTASATGPCPIIIQTSRTHRHWKFTQHLRTTPPPPFSLEGYKQITTEFYVLLLPYVCNQYLQHINK